MKKTDNHVTKYKTFRMYCVRIGQKVQQHIGNKQTTNTFSRCHTIRTRRRANATLHSMM